VNYGIQNESREYRDARESLLKDEHELVDKVKSVAERRRNLPLGGELKEDYVFQWAIDGKVGKSVKFSELFAEKDTLLLYSSQPFHITPDARRDLFHAAMFKSGLIHRTKNASAQRAERRSLTAGSLSSPQRHDEARSPPLRACCAHAENDQATAAPPTSAMKFCRRRRPKRLEASLTMKLPRRVSTRSDVDHAPSRPRGDVGPAQHTRRDYEEGAPSSSRWPMPATAERHAASSLI
jgi:hypothetical protein